MFGIFQRFIPPTGSHITCRGRTDGAGAQVMARISAMAYARLRGLRYAHSPLADVAHVPPGSDPGDWARRWEQFYQLGDGEPSAAEFEARGTLRTVTLRKPHRAWLMPGRLYVVAHCHKVTNRHPEALAAVAPLVRQRYFSSPKPAIETPPPGRVVVAVHVRRGDVGPGGQFGERYSGDQEIRATVAKLLDVLGRDRVVLRVCSEGTPADFPALAPLAPEWRLGEDAFRTFHELVQADVLVMAKSCFSYLAGMIGGQACIYEPFWHPPLPGWWSAQALPAAAELTRALERSRGNRAATRR